MTEVLHTTVAATGFIYGEGPRWRDGLLWFTDGPAGAIRTMDETGQIDIAVETAHPSGLGWLPDGTLVISGLYEATLKQREGDTVTVSHDLSLLAWSTNDMVVAPDGSIYVDLYHLNDDGISGDIALVTPNGEVRIVASDLLLPNGLGITPDGRTLVASDTWGERILAFDIEPGGNLCNQRVFAELGKDKHPDGLCLDAEGAVWVGCYDAEVFLRIRPGGEVTHRVETGGGWAVAPALGGADRRSLFLIINDTSHERLGKGESSGRVESVHVEVPGAGSP